MKIVIQKGGALDIELLDWAEGLVELEHRPILWHKNDAAPFVMFQQETPQAVILFSSQLDDCIFKVIKRYNHQCKFLIYTDTTANLTELLGVHSHEKPLCSLISPTDISPCINPILCKESREHQLDEDITYIGPYHYKVFDVMKLLPNRQISIFGHGPWYTPNHKGVVKYSNVPGLMQKSKVILYLEDRQGWQLAYAAYYNKPCIVLPELYEKKPFYYENMIPIQENLMNKLDIEPKTISVKTNKEIAKQLLKHIKAKS